MGSKDNTSTSSQTYGPPEWVADSYKKLFANAQQTAQTPYNPATGQQVAGMNAGQQTAIGAIQGATGVAQPYINQAADYARTGAAPVTGSDIASYQNPWTDQVVNATQADFAHSNAQNAQAVNSNAAKIGALTGDRSQVAQQMQQESENRTQNPIIANLRSQGFNTAAGLAEADKGRAGQAAYTFGNLGNEAQTTTLTGQQAALGASGLNQQQQQTELNAATGNAKAASAYPFQIQQWLAGIQSGIGSLAGGTSSGTQTTPGPNPWSQALGAGLSAAALFSDARLKDDIEEIGKTHDGQPIYRYRMAGRPETQIGLMAQDVERRHPEAVGSSQGFKTVDYKAATDGSVINRGYADGGGVVPYGGSYLPDMAIAHGNGPQPGQMPSAPQQQGGSSGGIMDMMKDFHAAHGAMSKIGQKARTTTDPASGWSTTVNPSSPQGWGDYIGNTLNGWGGELSSGIGSLFHGFADGGEVDDVTDLYPGDDNVYAATPAYAPPMADTRPQMPQQVPRMAMMPGVNPGVLAASGGLPQGPAPQSMPQPQQGVASAQPSERQGPLFGLIDDKYRGAMLAAGLGMLTSKSHNFGNAVGEGGIAGLQQYSGEKKAAIDQRKVDISAQHMAAMAEQAQARLKTASEALKLKDEQAHNQVHAIGSDSNGRPVYAVVDPMTGGVKPLANTPGVADPNEVPASGDDALAGKPADYVARVKAIADYKNAPVTGSRNSAIMGDVMRYKPDYDAKNYSVAQKSLNEFSQNGQTGKAIYALNTALRHVDAMHKAYEKLGNVGWLPGVTNAVKQGFARNAGDEAMQKALGEFENEKNGVAVEIDKALKGVGAPDVAGMKDIKDGFHATMAPAEFNGAVTGAVKLLEGRLRGADKAWRDSVIGHTQHPEWLDKDTREIYQRLGGDLEPAGVASEPQEMDPKTAKPGDVFLYKGHTIRVAPNGKFEQVP